MRRVLVIENQRLLGAGIENLLRREAGLHVVGVTQDNQGALLQAIGCSRANVVVLDKSMIDPTRLIALLEHHPGLRVVSVSADNGLVRTYEAQQVIVTQVSELVALIKS